METRLCLVSTEKNVKCRCRSIFLILCLNCCLSVAPSSRGNVRKNLLFLCFQPMAATRNGVVNVTGFTVQDTRFCSTVSCKKKKKKKVLSVRLMLNRCRINPWRETSVFCSHCIWKYYRTSKRLQKDIYSGCNCWYFIFSAQTKPQVLILISSHLSLVWVGKFLVCWCHWQSKVLHVALINSI